MKRVLFVCTANICRSPAAEAIFNALAEDRNLDVHATSAGVSAVADRGIAPETVMALEEVGIYPEDHRSARVTRDSIENVDLVLTMNGNHVEELQAMMLDLPDYVYVLPEYAAGTSGYSIPDPYGYTISAHRATVRQLLEAIEILLDRLGK